MNASTEPTGDGELLALIDRHAEAIRAVAARRAVGLDCERARTALLTHISRHYVSRREIASRDDRHNY